MKNDKLDNRIRAEFHKEKIPDAKLAMGSLTGKYPVVLDDGRTIIYIADRSKEEETRKKYELLKAAKLPSHSQRFRS